MQQEIAMCLTNLQQRNNKSLFVLKTPAPLQQNYLNKTNNFCNKKYFDTTILAPYATKKTYCYKISN